MIDYTCQHCAATPCEGSAAECGAPHDGRGTLDHVFQTSLNEAGVNTNERRALDFSKPPLFFCEVLPEPVIAEF